MIAALIWRGHKTATSALAIITVALVAILSGTLSVATGSADKANELKRQGRVTTDTVQSINMLEGVSVYSALVFAIAVVVSLLMLTSVSQFLIASASPTVRSLRLNGVSQIRVRLAFVAVTVIIAVLSALSALALTPLTIQGYSYILSAAGIDVSDVSIDPSYRVIFWVAIIAAAFSGAVVFWASRAVASLRTEAKARRRWLPILLLTFRIVAFIGVVAGLIAIFRSEVTLENINELTFGAMFTSLLSAWCILPLGIMLIGVFLKGFGANGLVAGGLLKEHANRVSGLALISSLLLSLGGASAVLTLASSSAGQFLAMNSISADAVVDEGVEGTSEDVQISPFNFDQGWLLKDEPAESIPVVMFDPGVMQEMIDPAALNSGELTDVSGSQVIADGSRYSIGDKISIVDDGGHEQELTVVALSDSHSILRGTIGVDSNTFLPSSPLNLKHRSYAVSEGGIAKVSTAFPGVKWKTLEEYVEEDLKVSQASQKASVLSMIGGVSLVALFGLLYGVVGFSVDLRSSSMSLRRLGAGKTALRRPFLILGVAIAVGAAILGTCGLIAVWLRVNDLFDALGVTYPVSVPWGMLVGMWALTAVLAVGGMVLGAIEEAEERPTMIARSTR